LHTEDRNTDRLQAKPTHQNIIRLAPPLVITEEEVQKALRIIGEACAELPSLKGVKEDTEIPPPEKNVVVTVDN
jgi:ornithine--oxo-acid transaminase